MLDIFFLNQLQEARINAVKATPEVLRPDTALALHVDVGSGTSLWPN